jgi:lysophospholipase L1-like esterase
MGRERRSKFANDAKSNADLASSLAQRPIKDDVRLKEIKLELEDLSPTTLAAIEGGEGTSFNLLSIPQNGSVTPEKTSFIELSENRDRFINKTIYLNTYVQAHNGVPVTHATFSASDFIEVEAETTYNFWRSDGSSIAGSNITVFFNANKEYISNVYVLTPITTPVDCKYIRINMNEATSFETLIMQKGSVKIEDIPNPKLIGIDVDVSTNNLAVEIDNLTFALEPTNKDWFIDKTLLNKIYVQADGKAIAHDSFNSSNFIRVEPQTTYHFAMTDGKAFTVQGKAYYDENKVFLSYAYNGNTITTPVNCRYIRFSVTLAEVTSFSTIVLQKGTAMSLPIGKKMIVGLSPDSGVIGKKWVVFGDSITEKNFRTTINYHDYIRAETNMNVVNMGVGGSGFKAREDTTNAFYQRISSVPLDTDVITIFGGINDAMSNLTIGEVTDTGTSTVCGCINTMLDNLYTVLPFAQVGIITPIPSKDYNPNNTSNYLSQLSEKIVAISRIRGIPCLDLYHCSGLRPWNSAVNLQMFSCITVPEGDGLHPNALGHKAIYRKIMEFVKSI